MSGSIRSWIHYIDLRANEDTQKEHRKIALEIKEIFKINFPNTSKSLEWS
jgi:thymidylate synthase (FAD)